MLLMFVDGRSAGSNQDKTTKGGWRTEAAEAGPPPKQQTSNKKKETRLRRRLTLSPSGGPVRRVLVVMVERHP